MPATQYNEAFTDDESVNNSPRSTFIYKDLNLYFTRNPVTSDVSIVTDIQDIKRAVRNLVLLNPGEKPFHPEIGTGVRGALFENFSPPILADLRSKITNSINRWEPRVSLQKVNFGLEDHHLNNNELRCEISFIINNVPDQLHTIEVMLERIR